MDRRYPPRYTPGFAQDKIPDPYEWVDDAAPWFIFFLVILLLGFLVWRLA